MPTAFPSLPCPACAALVLDVDEYLRHHINWHERTGTMRPGGRQELEDQFRRARYLALEALGEADQDETAKLPPIGDTIRRRPPVPAPIRELSGPQLVRALMAELEQELRDEEADDL